MIQQDTIDNIINFFKINLNMLPLGKEENTVKFIDGQNLFVFMFDIEKQHTQINYYMLPIKDNSEYIMTFPFYMETIIVDFLDKKEEDIGQEILDSIAKFDFSKETLINKMKKFVNIINPDQEV